MTWIYNVAKKSFTHNGKLNFMPFMLVQLDIKTTQIMSAR